MTSSAQGTGPVPMYRTCARCGESKRRHSFSADAWRSKAPGRRVCKACRAKDASARGPKVPTLTEHQLDLIRRELRCDSCEAYPQPQADGKVWTKHGKGCEAPWVK